MSSPEENESFGSGLCRKNIETLLAAVAQTQGFDDDEAVTTTVERAGGNDNGGESTSAGIWGMDDQQVVGTPPEIDSDVVELQPYTVVMCLPAARARQQMMASGGKRKRTSKEKDPVAAEKPPPRKREKHEVEEGVLPAIRAGQQMISSGEKRKRGRRPKGPVEAAAKPPPPKREKQEEEEDVCFICFDGGSLVLCDRRGCPKAYHPACIKRDEEFFSSTTVWNCGWHICTICLKSSHYMCYTCTYSLCKRCTKDADYVCVRGNKGFCATCMKTIMLIEKKDPANNETVQVDFDDKTSWEYLFKVYWVFLKQKLSLTMSELTEAGKPLEDVAMVPRKRRLNNVYRNGHGRKVTNSYRSSEHFELNKSEELHGLVYKDPLRTEISSNDKDVRTSNKKEPDETSQNLYTKKQIIDEGPDQSCIDRGTEKPNIEKGVNKPSNDRDAKWGSKDVMQERAPRKKIDEYAAIDFQNISLIYLRRNLMEALIKDEKFHEMVVGSFVRIRVSSNDHQEDFYRLVQVVGTVKTAEPHKAGCKTTDIRLEVLNLDKKEALSIDAISDQVFSEDECRQLRRSIKHGLRKPLTVGDVHKKAMALQAVRMNEPLEAEISQLNRLLGQASEEGQKKECRERIQEIQLLKLEHQRKLCEVTEIHADPKMNPNYESEEDTKLGNNSKPGIEDGSIQLQNRIDEKIDSNGSRSLEKYASQDNISSLATDGCDQAMMESGLETSITTGSIGNLSSANTIETGNLWHYRDPNGKIQGPFSMMHFRKWSMTGLFPPDMRIWTNHEEYDSVLLISALNGRFHEAPKLPDNISSESQKFEAISDNRFVSCDARLERADESGSSPHLSFNHCTQHGEENSSGRTEIQMAGGNDCENKQSQVGQSSQENLGSVLSSKNIESSSDFVPVTRSPNLSKHDGDIDLSRLPTTPETCIKDWEVQTAEKQQSVCSDIPMQSSGIFKFPSAGPDEWCGYSPTHAKASVEEWDSCLVAGSSLKPPKSLNDAYTSLANMLTLSSSSHPTSDITSWQASSNEKIEIDALGEDLVSDLLTEVMESQGGLPSPTSAIKFEKELIQDCNDGCFSSIEEFSRTRDPGKSEALSSSGEMQFTCQSQANALDPLRSSCVQSSASSEGETNGPSFRVDAGSDFHPPAPNTSQDMVGTTLALGTGSETVDPGWGNVQGNINLVTVQGNVNLVLGGHAQGIPNLGFTNPGTSWGNPNMNHSAPNGSLPWDNQRKNGGQSFASPRDWGYQSGDQGFGRGRPPWGRHPYGGGAAAAGGYSRPLPKGQRVCKFYESGHCKKGAFCDYLHP
ncbi:zinc finger CCCH domain-containing protein 44-like [Olea europaea var. sylvestris]|uniref:zinc finger CCCH domain-containing protein 44-like n=1 Tax=Olea europaea var. sylvestris TaxID=158386 RepID=UPI000C1D87CE|nr:zinc finger CCCH domain-containing protein 44-like [Olea europaea var. sylvestris]